MNKSFILFIGVLLILNSISAQEITLSNLTVTPHTFCLDKDNFFNITPLDVYSNFTQVDFINYTLPKNFKSAGIYLSQQYNTYQMLITSDNATQLFQNTIFNYTVVQNGKNVNQIIDINVLHCLTFKDKLINFTRGWDRFIQRNMDTVLLLGIVLIISIVLLKFIK